MKATCSLAIFLLFAPLSDARSKEKNLCKGHPQVVGKCFTVHGRLTPYNGNPTYRIWRIGTTRILVVTETRGDIENGNMPREIEEKLNIFANDIYGDFEVCPFTKDAPGKMQLICIESAQNLIVQKR